MVCDTVPQKNQSNKWKKQFDSFDSNGKTLYLEMITLPFTLHNPIPATDGSGNPFWERMKPKAHESFQKDWSGQRDRLMDKM